MWLMSELRTTSAFSHVELALAPAAVHAGHARDVVLAATRPEHRADEDQIEDVLELARLVEVVHALVLHELAHDLHRDLVAPVVVRGHRDVVDEDEHLLVAWRPKVLARALLDRVLDLALEDGGRGRGREGHLLDHEDILVLAPEVLEHGARLGRTRATNEEHRAELLDREAHRCGSSRRSG
jgi:hypothetical protein